MGHPSSFSSNIPVRVPRDVEIPPQSELILHCCMDIPPSVPVSDTFLVTEHPRESLPDLYIPPVLVSPKSASCPVLFVNPTAAPIKLFKRMHIALASKVNAFTTPGTTSAGHCNALTETASSDIDPSFAIDLSDCDITPEERLELRTLLDKYSGVFSKSNYDLGRVKVEPFDIRLNTDKPIRSKPRIVPHRFREQLAKHVEEQVKAGIMTPSDTPYCSPVVLIQKRDNSLRPCF